MLSLPTHAPTCRAPIPILTHGPANHYHNRAHQVIEPVLVVSAMHDLHQRSLKPIEKQ